MTSFKNVSYGLLFYGLIACGGLLIGACSETGHPGSDARLSQESADSSDISPSTRSYIKTVKPGAAFHFSHEFRFKPQMGQANFVELNIAHPYEAGRIALQATADPGLELSDLTTSFDSEVQAGDDEVWEIGFTPRTDGVHYINIMARHRQSGRSDQMRAFSIRVEVGDIPPKAIRPDTATKTGSPSAQTYTILEADELQPEQD